MSVPYQQVFSRRASPFMRWALSPFLLLFAAVFFIPLLESIEEHRQTGVIATSLVILLCVAGFLALWGVPFVGRIVTGIIAFGYGWYVVDQCIINFSGSWGWGGPKSGTTPINSILGFFVFGLPCLIYTIFGRFTFRREPDFDPNLDAFDDFDDNEFDEEDQGEQAGTGQPATRSQSKSEGSDKPQPEAERRSR
jgi:hypothetical protein